MGLEISVVICVLTLVHVSPEGAAVCGRLGARHDRKRVCPSTRSVEFRALYPSKLRV